MEKCSFLREYMIFVDYVRLYMKEDDMTDLEQAINRAIDRCIEENVLKDFLTERRSEVVKVMTLDYTFERRLLLEREEAASDGHALGLEQGRTEGLTQGRTEGELVKLIQLTHKKYKKKLTAEETADMLEEDAETIRKIYRAIEVAGSEDADKIYRQYINEN